MIYKKRSLVICLITGTLLSGCDAIQEKRNNNAFKTLYAASYNWENKLKIEYCLNSGRVSLFYIGNSTSVQERLNGQKDYLKILECFKSKNDPKKFESYKANYQDALARHNDSLKAAAERKLAEREISQIKSNYSKFFGVIEERPEIGYARDQYLKYQYCVVNPAYRDSFDLKLREVDKVKDSSEIMKCVRTVELREVVSINDAIVEREREKRELALEQVIENLSGRLK